MKNFKQTILLLGIAFIPFAVIAMEDKTNNPNINKIKSGYHRKTSSVKIKEYLDLDDSKVEYNTGCGMQYYKEYHARRREKNLVSFPLESCDPLPIESCGDIRFFFTSAVTGTRYNQEGQPYIITDPSIKQMIVVRGKANSNNNWAQVYIGFDPDDFKLVGYKGCKKIYTARIMAIQQKNKATVEQNGGSSFLAAWSIMNGGGGWIRTFAMPEIKNLDPAALGQEVKKHLTDPIKGGWKSPIFQEKLQELLGKHYKNLNGQWLLSPICYWTQEENKLKGITYRSYTK